MMVVPKPFQKLPEFCNVEIEFASEFPWLYARMTEFPTLRPRDWKQSLHTARLYRPIVEALNARGLNMLYLGDLPRSVRERVVVGEVLIEWLRRIEEPQAFGGCLGVLVAHAWPATITENRQIILDLARKWNSQLPATGADSTISRLTKCVAMVANDDDIPELFSWVRDRSLAIELRASYVVKLQQFAKVPGAVRDFLVGLLGDEVLGPAAVRSLSKALQEDALPMFRELQEKNSHVGIREAAALARRKIEARIRRSSGFLCSDVT